MKKAWYQKGKKRERKRDLKIEMGLRDLVTWNTEGHCGGPEERRKAADEARHWEERSRKTIWEGIQAASLGAWQFVPSSHWFPCRIESSSGTETAGRTKASVGKWQNKDKWVGSLQSGMQA